MATTVRSSGTNSATTGTNISIVAPAGATNGDVVVCTIHVNTGTNTIADNNGATPFTEDLNDFGAGAAGGHTMSVFSRRLQAGDPGTYNFTQVVNSRWSVIAVAFQNPHPTDIYDVAPGTGNINSIQDTANGTITAPSINTLTNNAISVKAAFVDTQTGTFTTYPSGYTLQNFGTNQMCAFTYNVIASAGATGIGTFVSNTSTGRFAIDFAIKDETAVTGAGQVTWKSLLGAGL